MQSKGWRMELPERDNTPTSLFNPLTEDFSVNYATDANPPLTYTIRAQEIGTFPKYIVNHIIKHLSQQIIAKRGIKTNYEEAYNEAVKEMEVDL